MALFLVSGGIGKSAPFAVGDDAQWSHHHALAVKGDIESPPLGQVSSETTTETIIVEAVAR